MSITPKQRINLFICYAIEDHLVAQELFKYFKAESWIDPWLDIEKLLPGQNWGNEVEKAVNAADIVIVCLSNKSVVKEGYIQKELRDVLNKAMEKPEDAIFIIPLRLDDCAIPRSFKSIQYIDYFPKSNKPLAIKRILQSLEIRARSIIEKPAILTPEFRLIGSYKTSRKANEVLVTADLAYIANGGDGLVILDVSEPSVPKRKGQFHLENAVAVAVANGIAYVAQEGILKDYRLLKDRLVLIDINKPSEPKLIGHCEVVHKHNITHLAVSDNIAYLTGHNYLGIVDVSTSSNPTMLWEWEPPTNSGVPCNVVINNNILYVTAGWAGLFIFDVGNPNTPVKLGQFDTLGWIIDISIVSNTAFLTLGENGLMTLDVSDQTHPTLMGRLTTLGNVTNLSVVDNMAFVTYLHQRGDADTEAGLAAVNIEYPFELRIVSKYPSVELAQDVCAVNNLVYVVYEYRGLDILKI